MFLGIEDAYTSDGALVCDTGNKHSCCHVYYTQGGAPQLYIYISWCINTIN